jgi:hypothetical protein
MIGETQPAQVLRQTRNAYLHAHVKTFSTFRAPIAVWRAHCIVIVETSKAVAPPPPSLCAGPDNHRYLLMSQPTSASITLFSPALTSATNPSPFHRSPTASAIQTSDNPLKLVRERLRSPSLGPAITGAACIAEATNIGEIPIALADVAPPIGTGTCLGYENSAARTRQAKSP